MTEHFNENECAGLIIGSPLALALIMGGLALIVVGIFPRWAAETPIADVVFGGILFGAGCGLLCVLGFYHWHRDLVESERAADKMPLDLDD